MTRARASRTPATSRRRFLKTVALGSAAALATTALPRTGEARPARRTPRPAPAPASAPARSAALEAEIEKQKKSTDGLLKTIRDYALPAGSEPGFVFVATKPDRRPAKSRAATMTGGAR